MSEKRKVKLLEHNSSEQRDFKAFCDTRNYLTVGQVYDADIEVHSWHTKIIIEGRGYNSVCFQVLPTMGEENTNLQEQLAEKDAKVVDLCCSIARDTCTLGRLHAELEASRTEVDSLKAIKLELLEALKAAYDHLEYCGFGDKWESECAYESGLDKKIINAIKKVEEQL